MSLPVTSESKVFTVLGLADWRGRLSEMNVVWESIKKAEDPELGYDMGFSRQLTECIDDIAERKTRIITNAGAMDLLYWRVSFKNSGRTAVMVSSSDNAWE